MAWRRSCDAGQLVPPPLDTGYYVGGESFYDVLTRAVLDMTEFGYDSVDRVAMWLQRLKEAARRSLVPEATLDATLKATLRAVYRSKIERGGILKQHPGIGRFTLQQVAPRLRAELDRRIVASAGLIKLNRTRAIEDTLQRFSGWATSIPAGGTDAASRRAVKDQIRKPLASLPFRERRVLVDQGHKFAANLSNILATDGGAIALIWHSNWRQLNYDYREDHKERDLKVYMLRDNWAQRAGLVKAGAAGYYDQVTAVGEEVFCRCFAQYLYSLRSLPADMLTAKGRIELERVRLAT